MPLNYEVRGTFEVQNKQATGWCWSQQRPDEALRVEVLSDGKVVAQGIAARLVPELVRPGVTDGYHGYTLVLPKELPHTAILEAREVHTRKVFGRRLPKILPDIMGWQRRVAQLGNTVGQLHDRLGQSSQAEARWSAAWSVGGALLDRSVAKGQSARLAAGLALRPITEPLWTFIIDLPRAVSSAAEATARWEVMQLAPLLSIARAELMVIDDGRAAGFLTRVHGLQYAAVPPGAGDVERLNLGLSVARGVHVAIFIPVSAAPTSLGLVSGTLRSRAALLDEPPVGKVVVGGGAAAAIRGAGLDELASIVEPAAIEMGVLLMVSRAVCETLGGLDPTMDDGADLAILDFALRARAAGVTVRVLEEATSSFRPTQNRSQARNSFSKMYARRNR